jgi:hypothetical protein
MRAMPKVAPRVAPAARAAAAAKTKVFLSADMGVVSLRSKMCYPQTMVAYTSCYELKVRLLVVLSTEDKVSSMVLMTKYSDNENNA